MEFPVGKLVALGDGNDVIHVRQKLQVFAREFFLVANHADDRDFLALGEMCGETVEMCIRDSFYVMKGVVEEFFSKAGIRGKIRCV